MNMKELKVKYDAYKIIKTAKEALEAVKQDGYALQYVPESIMTEAIALEAVKQNGYALKYVPESIMTEAIALEAVKQNGYALQYVPKSIFRNMVDEMTLEEVCRELGRTIKIIK